MPPKKINITPKKKPIRVLELFKGTGSVEKAIKKLYPDADIISNDIVAKFNPTILCDFMDLDYTQWKPGHFDIVWASPPCTYYSSMQRFSPRSKEFKEQKLKESNELVKRVIDCIDYLKPKKWFLENPQMGTLKNQDFMKDLDYCDATYCMYGYPYRKQTRFWTNSPKELKLCSRSKKSSAPHCPIFDTVNGRHPNAISWHTDDRYNKKFTTTLEQRYSIPQELLVELFE